MTNLSDVLKKEAIERNLCAVWQKNWKDNSSQQELIEKYKKGIDFVIEQGEWPTNEFIVENFDRELLHRNLIFVDETVTMENAPSGVYVLNGACTGVLNFSHWAAATVYVRHQSNVRIFAEDFAKVFVRVYDEAQVETGCDDSAVLKVYDRR